MDIMRALSDVMIDKPLGIGGVIVPKILGLDCDILCTSNVLLETERRN
jgi:CxxC motif-containing protein